MTLIWKCSFHSDIPLFGRMLAKSTQCICYLIFPALQYLDILKIVSGLKSFNSGFTMQIYLSVKVKVSVDRSVNCISFHDCILVITTL